jgi:2-dehydro-3-deoxygluconokinase
VPAIEPPDFACAAALDVVTAGEAMALFAAQQAGPLESVDGFQRALAGAELNVAIGLARLGLKVGYVSRVGDDSFGRHLQAVLDAEGIDRRHLAMDAQHPTGFMLKSRNDDGSDPAIEYFRRGSAASHLRVADYPGDYFAASRHLHLTGIYVAVSPSTREFVLRAAQDARTAGRSLSFDPNLRPRLWASRADMVDTLNHLASLSDWVLPGLDEGRLLTGHDHPEDIADFYLARGARVVVVKLGAQGAFHASAVGRGRVPGRQVARVIDTVGAGDGFAVGVISGLLEGLELPEAVARGNAIGARVVQFPGDSDGLPTRAQLDADGA